MEENNINNETNNNNKKIIIIALISIVVIGLVGYIVYDKCFNKPEEEIKNNTKEENNSNEEIEDDETIEKNDVDLEIDYIINNIPKDNDSKVTGNDIHKEFKNGERHEKKFTLNYNNYKIVHYYYDGGGDSSTIKIFKNNKEVYINEGVKTKIVTQDVDEYDVLPAIKDGKLHLVVYNPDKCYVYEDEEEKQPYLEYIQIDLNKDEIKVDTIKSLKFLNAEFYTPDGSAPECK